MLTFYVAPTQNTANECALDCIKESRKNGRRVLILTPDRMNFRIQSYVFDVLHEKSLFDVEVNTLTRVVERYLANTGKKEVVLSKQAGIGIVKNILLSHKDKLTCFAKSSYYDGFASVVYEMICMFKSCNLTPESIAEHTSSPMLTAKLQELAFIYKEYETFLSRQFSDSFNRLDLYCSSIKKEDFSNVDVYWIGFEDVTAKMLAIMTKMAKFTRVSVSVSYQKKEACHNYLLYKIAPYLTMVDFCHAQGVAYESIWCKEQTQDKAFLSSHLFGVSSDTYTLTTSDYSILQADTKADEVAYILRSIGLQVVKGQASYDDFAIVLSQFEGYKEEIVSQAKECQIPLYLDESISFIEHAYVRLVFDLLHLLDGSMSADRLVEILKKPIFKIGRHTLEVLENWITYTGTKWASLSTFVCIEQEEDYDKIVQIFNQLTDSSTKLKQAHLFSEFSLLVKQLLNDIEYVSFLGTKQQEFLQNGEYELARSTAQLYSKWTTLWTELDKVLGDTQCTFGDYIRILQSVATDMTISLPPMTHHSVKVYNLTKSELTPAKYMYFLGANANQFPSLSLDSGIVSDEEMAKLSYAKRLSPTIKQLNDRAKRKVLDALLLSNHTILSYPTSDEGGATLLGATVVDELLSMLSISPVSVSPMLDLNAVCNLNDDKLLDLQCFSPYLARNAYAKLVTSQTGQKQELITLSMFNDLCKDKSYIEQYYDEYDRPEIKGAYDVFYPKHSSSVSQFERYFACPYQHFVKYGLRLKEKEDSRVTSREVGNILHLFCMRFVQALGQGKIEEGAIQSIAEEHLANILSLQEFARFAGDESNYFVLMSLRDEVVRLAKFLCSEKEYSKYVPVVLEGNFDKDALTLSVDGKKITLKGKIDRVDKYAGTFRIVDYKTGADHFTYTDIASGKKLQLLIYVLAYRHMTNSTPASAVYLPIRNKFSKDEEFSYTYDGIIPNNHSMLTAMDSRLSDNNYTSTVVKASTNESGDLAKVHELMLDSDDLSELCSYAYRKLEEGYRLSLLGNIAPYPLVSQNKSACDYCQYLSMCKFSKYKGDKEHIVEKTTLDELLGKEGQDETNN